MSVVCLSVCHAFWREKGLCRKGATPFFIGADGSRPLRVTLSAQGLLRLPALCCRRHCNAAGTLLARITLCATPRLERAQRPARTPLCATPCAPVTRLRTLRPVRIPLCAPPSAPVTRPPGARRAGDGTLYLAAPDDMLPDSYLAMHEQDPLAAQALFWANT